MILTMTKQGHTAVGYLHETVSGLVWKNNPATATNFEDSEAKTLLEGLRNESPSPGITYGSMPGPLRRYTVVLSRAVHSVAEMTVYVPGDKDSYEAERIARERIDEARWHTEPEELKVTAVSG